MLRMVWVVPLISTNESEEHQLGTQKLAQAKLAQDIYSFYL